MQLLPVSGAIQYIRFLSFQLTGHLVWVSVEPMVGNMLPKRVPNCSPELDYGVYSGPGPTDINQFWREFKAYNLVSFVVKPPPTIGLSPLPDEFADEIRLSRAKCYATQLINNQTNWVMEKNGLNENPIAASGLDRDRIAEIYQRQHNINSSQARKLVDFKLDEHLSKYNELRYVQIEADLSIVNAKSVDEVVKTYNETLKSLGSARTNEALLTRFL